MAVPPLSSNASSTTPRTPFLSQFFLSSTLQLPSTPQQANPRRGQYTLLSTRDPLSIPISTANFRRFVAKIGPVFWLQDRVEEILLWKKGWKLTAVWMAIYAFFCYFPRLLLLVPLVILLGIMVSTHPQLEPPSADKSSTAPSPTVVEGSVDWQANLQAIQNLMGAYSDLYDAVIPYVPHLTHGTSTTAPVLTLTLLILAALIPVTQLLPLRPLFVFFGLVPFVLTHPRISILLPRLMDMVSYNRPAPVVTRTLDDDRLTDRHWRSEMRTVELWENERFSWPSPAGADADGWGKGNLRPGERVAWTRGRDGWSGVAADGSGQVSSDLTFPLPTGWHFVETEDWRPDIESLWIAPLSCDANGWVYTNDAWLDPRPAPADEWKTRGATRRRRWLRRIYYNPTPEK